MPRPRRLPIALVLLAAAGPPAHAQEPARPATIELTVSPREAPTPTLAYRLLPMESERTPGDAAPVYLRLGNEFQDKARAEIAEKTAAWLALPIDKLPTAEARKFVDRWGSRIQQLQFAARRRTCDWNYTLLEQKEQAYDILLPDAQELRGSLPLLGVKARVEILEHKYDEAARTIATGLSMSRHLAGAPFLVNNLVGSACAMDMLDRVAELIARPDAPNLTWALIALPRPLIDIRAASETEQKMGDWIIPEFVESRRHRSDAEWTALLGRLQARLDSLPVENSGGAEPRRTRFDAFRTKLLFRTRVLPDALKFVKDHPAFGDRVGDDQAIVLYLAATYAALRDDLAKGSYLSYPEALPFYEQSDRRVKEVAAGPLRSIASLFPSGGMAHRAAALLDRRVALLRLAEAIRFHAAAHGGKLPVSLAEIKAVPIPADPVTGMPFGYRLDGDAAIIAGLPPLTADWASTYASAGATYRIVLRP